jgi:hypothetical protein
MFFHYNNVKLTNANSQGFMAAVWQSSQRALWYNAYGDGGYSQYADTPELCISVSPDNGNTWSEPLVLNNVDTPQLAGIKPMWVYPADRMIYAGIEDGYKANLLGLLFYDDYTWGSNALSPPYHPAIDGGRVMFMELKILYPYIVVDIVATPYFNPPAGSYLFAQTLTIRCTTPGATIRYTLDGSEPTQSSPAYWYPIILGQSTTVKARAYLTDWIPSQIAAASYEITIPSVATPAFSPEPGDYTGPTAVTVHCDTPGAVIRHTTDGSEPDASSPQYSGPLLFVCATTLKARAFHTDWNPSPVATGYYNVTSIVATPVFSPSPGDYATAQNVSIACETPGAQIRYTTDGSEPTQDSPLYADPIPVTGKTTIKARGFKNLWVPGGIATGVYTITPDIPGEPVPVVTGIKSVYPNPFRGSATISLGLKEANSPYQLRIYNLKGECVHARDGVADGWFELAWDGTNQSGVRVSPGVYLLSFASGRHRSRCKLVLM